MVGKKILLAALFGLLAAGMAAVRAADWPQFRGPKRDGKSSETGLLKKWPEGGPKLIRTISGIGEGYSSPAIAGGRIYSTGKVKNELRIFCFDMKGKKLWEKANGEAFSRGYPGARATPTIDGKTLYVMNGNGLLGAFNVDDGSKLWSVNIAERFVARLPTYGYAESVLIDGNNLICTPGGREGCIAALDKKTGKTVWASKGFRASAEYASPILIEYKNTRLIAQMTKGGLVGVSAKDGRFLWSYKRPISRRRSCPSPAYADGMVFEATGYGTAGGAVKLSVNDSNVTAVQAWETKDMNCHHGGYVIVDGHIYGNHGRGWACIDLKTGKTKWTGAGPGKGSCMYADGMLYCLGQQGTMGLLEAKPGGCTMVSSFSIPNAGKKTWAYPVIAGARLFIRRDEKLFIYDIKK